MWHPSRQFSQIPKKANKRVDKVTVAAAGLAREIIEGLVRVLVVVEGHAFEGFVGVEGHYPRSLKGDGTASHQAVG